MKYGCLVINICKESFSKCTISNSHQHDKPLTDKIRGCDSQPPAPTPSDFGEGLRQHLGITSWGFPVTKGFFRKVRYSFSTDKFNEIKDDEIYKYDKRDRVYDLPS